MHHATTAALVTLLLFAPSDATPARRSELRCSILPRLIDMTLRSHVHFDELTADVKQRAIDSYLRRLDPSRVLLTRAEASAMRASLAGLFVSNGRVDCGILRSTHRAMMARQRSVEEVVRGVVMKPGYTIDESVELQIDPDKRGFPEDAAARNALITRLVHFQMASYVTAGTELNEAKRLLVHRYELMTRRAQQRTDPELEGAFLDAFASALDPHTNYLSADEMEDFRIMMRLSLEGIGAQLSSRDGYVTVEQIVPGGAADRHGQLKPKDKIIAVAQEGKEPVNVIDMPLRDVVRMIRGKKGTPVRLTILRQDPKTTRLSLTIVRDEIKLEDQAASLRIETVKRKGRQLRLGVLELPSFYGDMESGGRRSLTDVKRLLVQANSERLDGLLLDLSRNGGGLLDEAVAISGLFIRSGPVVAVRDTIQGTRVLEDEDPRTQWTGPLVVLTSRVSASASEILAGALQDYKRAVIVGDTQTFGKGTVQTVIPLPDLGALKVTIGIFYLPGGKSTQARGVRADVVVPSPTDSPEIGEAAIPYALPPEAMRSFAGDRVNDTKVAARFAPVDDGTVQRLAIWSQTRVASNQALRELRGKLDEAARNGGRVKLKELMRESQETDGDKEKKAEDDAPYLREALNVLADLVARRG